MAAPSQPGSLRPGRTAAGEGRTGPGNEQLRPARRRRRGCLFALAAVVLSLVVAMALLEAGFRMFWTLPPMMAEFQQAGLYVATPGGGTGLAPGYRGTLQLTDADPVTQVAINNLGMRGADVGPKRAGERRLLCVGDSLVFGYGVEAEHTFAARLEWQLRSRGMDVTIGNGGVSGFGSFDAALRIADLRPVFAPDAVLFCCFLGNDAVDNRGSDFEVVDGVRLPGPLARLTRTSTRARLALRSRFWLWAEAWLVANQPASSLFAQMASDDRLSRAREGFPGTPPNWAATHAGLFLDVIDERSAWPAAAPPVVPRVLADFRAAFTKARAATAGLPLAVLILPTWWHVDRDGYAAELQRLGFDPLQFRRGAMQERLRALCLELDLPVHDATPGLEAASSPAAMFLSDRGHLSPLGHSEVARQLVSVATSLWR
jgi:lysophospholipase L1-like esterase